VYHSSKHYLSALNWKNKRKSKSSQALRAELTVSMTGSPELETSTFRLASKPPLQTVPMTFTSNEKILTK
jgi:hypothetical protein